MGIIPLLRRCPMDSYETRLERTKNADRDATVVVLGLIFSVVLILACGYYLVKAIL